MSTKSLQIGLMGLFLCVASAWAATSSIQGIVKDAKGQPIKGADVRVESKDGKQLFNTVKTDASGRYISQGLPVATYRVTLVVNGAVRASIGNTTTKAQNVTQLNFDLRPASTAQAASGKKTGTHKVWMPATTGTHTGGRWVEVSDDASDAGALNVKRANAEELHRAQMNMGKAPPGQ